MSSTEVPRVVRRNGRIGEGLRGMMSFLQDSEQPLAQEILMPGRRTSLKDLIDAGLLTPGEELICQPRRGEQYAGSLQLDGSILSDGSEFRTLSDWATNSAGGERNGWRCVYAKGRPLEELRSQLESGSPPPVAQRAEPLDVDANSHDETTLAHSDVPQSVETSATSPGSPLPSRGEATSEISKRLLDRILQLTPIQFEKLVGEYLRVKGLVEVNNTQQSYDGGVDGDGTIPFLGVRVALQAKRYESQSVGVDAVAAFKGRIIGRYDRGVFITSSTFTAGAREVAAQASPNVILVDGRELVSQMIESGMGVKAVPIIRRELDEDFFDSFGK